MTIKYYFEDFVAGRVFEGGKRQLSEQDIIGFAREYDVERKWRETRLMQIAPISTNLILAYVAEHVLGMPRSY